MIGVAFWLLATSISTQVVSSSLKSCQNNQFLNQFNICVRCTVCSRNQQKIQDCAALSDTICLCPLNTFHHQGKVSCMRCRTCGVGEVMITPCQSNANTVCKPCPSGYTSYGNNSISCISLYSSSSANHITSSFQWSFAFSFVTLIFILVWR